MKKHLVLVFIFLIFGCCNNKKDYIIEIKQFPKEISLNYKEVDTPKYLLYVGNMFMTDSLLITIDLKADTIFRVFNLPELSYGFGFVRRGKGPFEEVEIDPFAQVIDSGLLIYKSLTNLKIIKINNKNAKIIKTIKLPGHLLNLSHILLLNNNFIVGWMWNQNSNKEFIGFSSNSNSYAEFGPNFPSLGKNLPKERNTAIFSKISTLKPDKTRFASAYDKVKMLRIYSDEGSLLNEIRFKSQTSIPEDLIFPGNKNSIGNLKTFYQRIKSTNNYIYALYSGKSVGSISNVENGNPDICDEIHVFDWNGNPVVKFKLNKLVSSFAVSNMDDIIICYSLSNPDKLYQFDITGFLNQE